MHGNLVKNGIVYVVNKMVNVEIGKARFGIVSRGMASAHWFLRDKGVCLWSISEDFEPQLHRQNEPKYFRTDSSNLFMAIDDKATVDVLLIIGKTAPNDRAYWERPELKVVMWIVERGKERQGAKANARRWPVGWEIIMSQVGHDEVGGVTNGRFVLGVAIRKGQSMFTFQLEKDRASNSLKQVLNPRERGRLMKGKTELVQNSKTNTPSGLLDWKRRRGQVLAPSVYSTTDLVQRVLTEVELASALDAPAHLTQDKSNVERINTVLVPGKIISHLLDGLHLVENNVCHRKRKWESLNSEEKQADVVDGDVTGTKKRHERSQTGNISKKRTRSPERRNRNDVPEVKMSSRDWFTRSSDQGVATKATKSDNADVPAHLWDLRVLEGLPWLENKMNCFRGPELANQVKRGIEILRNFFLKVWKRKVLNELETWMKIQGPSLSNFTIAQRRAAEVKKHVLGASWWTWDQGSTLFFWRWPLTYLEDALYGMKPRFDSQAPEYFVPQPKYDSEAIRMKVKNKVAKVIDRGYIQLCPQDKLASLMFMFDVPKGDDDIRMVYDASKSGLNDALWAPWFSLPTIDSMCRSLEPGCFCTDNDYGEFFLNFPMHQELQQYCGVDVTQLFPDMPRESQDLITGVWGRNAMGLKPSPYYSVQMGCRAKYLMKGNRWDAQNPFQWSRLMLNLPGTAGYDPRSPWISKRRPDGSVAVETYQYVDDLRNTGPTGILAWRASMQVGKWCSWLGMQDAPRKRREASQLPGAWSASMVSTVDGQLKKFVTQEAWDKARARILYLSYYAGCEVNKKDVNFDLEVELGYKTPLEPGNLIHKVAEKYRGYLVHISRTYTSMIPYLKGLHLSLESWRTDRDEEGWKLIGRQLGDYREKESSSNNTKERLKPAKVVATVDRFRDDMDALRRLFAEAAPPVLSVRPTSSWTMYIVGDASGSGFGSTAWRTTPTMGQPTFDAQYGGWTVEFGAESSNLREAYNAVLGFEEQLHKGNIPHGSEVFIFTDNDVTEKAFSKGSSKSKKLHELVIRLRKMEMKGELFIHVIWIAGTRMISQGTDSLSRGDLCSGVMAGDSYLSHIPINKGVPELEPELMRWLERSLPGSWTTLKPEDWFDKAFSNPKGKYIWAPAACVADVAVEQMCEVKLIHPGTSHVFLCPTLMTPRWRKSLGKLSDIYWTIPANTPLWPKNMHEPLTLAFAAPILSRKPWSIKRSKWLVDCGESLPRMFHGSKRDGGNYLRKFWTYAARMSDKLQGSMAFKVLSSESSRYIPSHGGPRFRGCTTRRIPIGRG